MKYNVKIMIDNSKIKNYQIIGIAGEEKGRTAGKNTT